jgi:hypothetical protein
MENAVLVNHFLGALGYIQISVIGVEGVGAVEVSSGRGSRRRSRKYEL